MITLEDYYGPWMHHEDATPERKATTTQFLPKVNALLTAAEADGVEVKANPTTKTQVSGERYGGFRPQDCQQGAAHSSHKEGCGVDVYDPENALDTWLDDDRLTTFDLYREHPDSTRGWCHLTDRAPRSGHRTFLP